MKFLTCYPCNLPFLVSQKWNENPSFYGTIGMKGHNGWDLAVPVGTPVYATHNGIIFYAQIDGTGAKTIAIDTRDYFEYDGKTVQFRSLYTHLSEIRVQEGQEVVRGQLIGLSGNTGRYTTGPHLHYGIHPILNGLETEQGNGYNGAIDPIHTFDGTYPNSKPVLCAVDTFGNMMMAVRAYQISRGIKDFQNETNPKKIQIGPKTLRAILQDSL